MLNYKAIGRKIAHYRKCSHYTQAALAELLGISESYMSQLECGKAEISLKRLNQIAEILNINIVTLLSDTNPIGENYGSSELFEIIKNWTPEQKDFLLNLLKCADDQIYQRDKKK